MSGIKDLESFAKAVDEQEKEAEEEAKKEPKGLVPMVVKSGGPFIGPKGGKWADPQHKIPWHDPAAADLGDFGSKDVKNLDDWVHRRTKEKKHYGTTWDHGMDDKGNLHVETGIISSVRGWKVNAKEVLESLRSETGLDWKQTKEGKGGVGYRFEAKEHDKIGKQSDSGSEMQAEKVASYKKYEGKEVKIADQATDKMMSGKVVGVEKKGTRNASLVVKWADGTQGGGFSPTDLDLEHKEDTGFRLRRSEGINELEAFAKGGPYIGPRGGKWKDPQHKIPWDEKPTKKTSKKAEAGSKENPLSKLPGNTDLKDNRGFEFSKWEGKLALVSGPTHYERNHPSEHSFDPATMSSKYHVRNAIDSRSKQPIPANEKHLGLEPGLSSNKLPYDQISFRVGGDIYGRVPPEEGRFDGGKDVWVANKLKDLSPAEKNKVQDHLESRGIKEGVSYNTSTQMGAAGWKKAFKQSYTEIQNNSDDYDTLNAVDHFLDNRGVDTSNEKEANEAWASVPGVYLTDKGGRLKSIIERKPKKGVKKSMEDTEMSGINDLEEFAKAQTMPTGNPKKKMGEGEEQGGKVAGVGKTSGSGDSDAGEPVNAPTAKKQKLSEDDADVDKQMKPGKKPIETIGKSDTTPQGQRQSVAQEHAAKVSQLKKGEDTVEATEPVEAPTAEPEEVQKSVPKKWNQGEDSRVDYSNQSDMEASELLKSNDFYSNGSPTKGRNPLLSQHVTCPECKETMSKSLSACPSCGHGSVQHKVMPGVAIGEQPMEKSFSKAPLLQPVKEEEVYLPNGFKHSDR